MPKLLLQRLRPDSISEFQSAARRRFAEANCLADADQRTGAVYLFGYVAEMQIKAAYFRAVGYAPRASISAADRRNAVGRAKNLGLTWLGNEHDVASWANLLALVRRATPGMGYALQFERTMLRFARGISRTWREIIRYHDNMAYSFELSTTRTAAEWFLKHSDQL